jgi:tRNA pseudouridine38-40 synthase
MRFRLEVTYDGTNYSGWQVQPNGKTIQDEIEKALKVILKEDIRITGSGRTDAGVHAFCQVAHFDYGQAIEKRKVRHSLNGILKPDIRVYSVDAVKDDFHAIKSVKKKTYSYLVLSEDVASPLMASRVTYVHNRLDIDLMREAAETLVGIHDFSAFKASDCCSRTQEREVYATEIIEKELFGRRVIEFLITGNGFLKHMVRNIIGTLLQVGEKKVNVEKFVEILKSCDRTKAGPTAPAQGLYLKEIKY